jgi:hypothetical protein
VALRRLVEWLARERLSGSRNIETTILPSGSGSLISRLVSGKEQLFNKITKERKSSDK